MTCKDKLLKRMFSFCLIFAIISSLIVVSTTVFADEQRIDESGASATISYTFTGEDKDKAGFAQGTITLKASDSGSAGKYYLYWADNTKALEGYKYIDAVSATTSGVNVTFVPQTAIPADATKIIAIKSDSEPSSKTVASASAVYNIPVSKQFPYTTADKLYTFASYSDIHIANDSYGSGKYKYDEQHLRKAFDSAASRDVSFIVTGGDNVNNQEGQNYSSEWKSYQKVLADSDYCNPIYESIGNHEIWTTPVSTATKAFIKATGLLCDETSLNSDKAYYTFDEPTTGDHFIMMALETSFYPDRNDEFSTAQINWVRGLLDKYKNDGHNTYIYEHAGFWKWGVGDDANDPYYDIPLKVDYTGNKALQQILYDYPDAFFFCGHTHIQFSDQLNYMDYDSAAGKRTAKMVHNSSVGGIRKILSATPHMGNMDRTNLLDETEGYFVDSYGKYVICNGANLYYNLINPKTTYIVEGTGSEVKPPVTSEPTTENKTYSVTYNIANSAYLTPDNYKRTVAQGDSYICTLKDSSGKTPSETETYTKTVTVKMGGQDITGSAVTSTGEDINKSFVVNIPKVTGNITITAGGKSEAKYKIGDVDMNGRVEVSDATLIQKAVAGIKTITSAQKALADVNDSKKVDVSDATMIQKKIAGLIASFPSESSEKTANLLYSSGTAQSDLKTLLTEVGTYLSSKYTYSSYDQYMAVKKIYRYCNSNINSLTESQCSNYYTDLNSKFSTLKSIAGEAVVPGTDYTVYFNNTSSWSTVKAYCWTGGTNNTWPGKAMTKVSGNIYKITVDSSYENIIFNNGSGTQTGNLDIQGDGYIYNYSTKSWSKYNG